MRSCEGCHASTGFATAYRQRIGEEVGVSEWMQVSQELIGAFADLTHDHQFIHVDAERAAAETPFGGTIAHGFLTLALLSHMASQARPQVEVSAMAVNYGFDKVRFLNPVPAGARVRGRFQLIAAEERSQGELTLCHRVTVEIEGHDRPALVADWLTRHYLGD